jgi:hypothetical protein
MRGAIPPLRQYVFMAWCLVKHRDNFNFIFYTLIYNIGLDLRRVENVVNGNEQNGKVFSEV